MYVCIKYKKVSQLMRSRKYVALKVAKGSLEYDQFSQLCILNRAHGTNYRSHLPFYNLCIMFYAYYYCYIPLNLII
jgi:hypothetical protein